jgi:hypothetical protein
MVAEFGAEVLSGLALELEIVPIVWPVLQHARNVSDLSWLYVLE